MATDAEIRAAGLYAVPNRQYLQNEFQLPTNEVVEEEETESFGIPQTQAFTNSGGNNYTGGFNQGLNPYNRPQGKPLDPNSFFGGLATAGKNFGSSMVDKFSGLPGVQKGKGFIRNIMNNTMIGRVAAMRDPLNPNSSNYNKNLQGQIDYLSGLSVDGKMMIGRDPGTGLGKYGPDSVLSGQNVVSGFGTNDYGKQLQNYMDKYGKTMPKERLKQLEDEIKGLQEDEDDKLEQKQKDIAISFKTRKDKDILAGIDPNKSSIDKGAAMYGDVTKSPGYYTPDGTPGGGAGQGIDISNAGTQRNEDNDFQGDSGPSNQQEADYGYGSDAAFYARGGRAGYFFGGRARLQGGGMSQGNEENQTQSANMGGGTTGDFSSQEQTDNNDAITGRGGKDEKTFYSPPNTKTNTLYEKTILGNFPVGLTKNMDIGRLSAILNLDKLEDKELEGKLQYDSSIGPFNTTASYDTITGPEFNASYNNNNLNANLNSKTGLGVNYSKDIGLGTFTAGGRYDPDGTFNTEAKYGITFANGGLASIL